MLALELRNIRKSFGPVRAVRGVDFGLAPGEVHALVGENGAGKSTLMHVAYGMTAPDSGTILVAGREVRLGSPRDARALGIGMVHQHFTSIAALTVGENIALGVGGRRPGARERLPSGVADRLKAGLTPGTLVRNLTVAERQRLEILKALATGARILLLDEPTALLAPLEVEELVALIRAFAREGGTVALITHKLQEVLEAADRVTVLRRGMVTLSGPVGEQTTASLARAMIGDEGGPKREARGAGEAGMGPFAALRVTPAAVTVRVGGIEVHAGELAGIAAVEGNGHREILRALAGLQASPGVSATGPVAFVPEDRITEGLIPELSITENIVLGLAEDPRWARGNRLDWAAARQRTLELIGEFEIVAPGPDTSVGTLSGGNQQKIVLARALERHPAVLVAENPTRGLDVRNTAEMHRRLRAAADAGVTVLVYSTDLDEVLEVADRVLVVWRGEVKEAPRGADRGLVGEMMLGLHPVNGER